MVVLSCHTVAPQEVLSRLTVVVLVCPAYLYVLLRAPCAPPCPSCISSGRQVILEAVSHPAGDHGLLFVALGCGPHRHSGPERQVARDMSQLELSEFIVSFTVKSKPEGSEGVAEWQGACLDI